MNEGKELGKEMNMEVGKESGKETRMGMGMEAGEEVGEEGEGGGQVESADHKEPRPIPPALPTHRKQNELHLHQPRPI